MDPEEQQANWNELGERDPFWAILSDPKKRNRKWNVDEFFKTGQVDIIRVMEQAQQLGLPLRRGMALDFGCGAGRLTQPLCQHFSHVIGVDVAPSMIELAKRYNHIANTPQHPGDYILELDMVQEAVAWFHDKGSKTAKVQVCLKEYLEKTPKTLDYATKVYKEGKGTGGKSKISKVASQIKDLFLRITGNRIFSYRTGLNFIPRIEMYGVSKEEVVGLVLDNGGKLVSAKENSTIAPQWISFIYWVTKNP